MSRALPDLSNSLGLLLSRAKALEGWDDDMGTHAESWLAPVVFSIYHQNQAKSKITF